MGYGRRYQGRISGRRHTMVIFPTRILFATDGSEDSELAGTTAVGLAKVTGSELHVLHVGPAVPEHFESTDVEPVRTEQEARRILDEQVEKIENVGAPSRKATSGWV